MQLGSSAIPMKDTVLHYVLQEMILQPKEVEQLPLQYYAEVTGAWATKDPQVLHVLDPLHVYTEGFLETRLKWRAKEPLTLLELRCYTLQQPLMIPVKERESYFGCFSWVELERADVMGGAGDSSSGEWVLQAALSDADFAQKQDILRDKLHLLQTEQLQV